MRHHHAAVGRNLIAFLKHHPVAADQLIGGELLQPPVAPDPHHRRQVAG